MNALILNTCSNSLMFALFKIEGERELARGEIDLSMQPARVSIDWPEQPTVRLLQRLDGPVHAVAKILEQLVLGAHRTTDMVAVGHRVVHGGGQFRSAVRITPEVEEAIDRRGGLSPQHNSASLQVIRAARLLLPHAQHIALFETAFHSTFPEAAPTFAVQREYTNDSGVL